jgi:hypothetical protein
MLLVMLSHMHATPTVGLCLLLSDNVLKFRSRRQKWLVV